MNKKLLSLALVGALASVALAQAISRYTIAKSLIAATGVVGTGILFAKKHPIVAAGWFGTAALSFLLTNEHQYKTKRANVLQSAKEARQWLDQEHEIYRAEKIKKETAVLAKAAENALDRAKVATNALEKATDYKIKTETVNTIRATLDYCKSSKALIYDTNPISYHGYQVKISKKVKQLKISIIETSSRVMVYDNSIDIQENLNIDDYVDKIMAIISK